MNDLVFTIMRDLAILVIGFIAGEAWGWRGARNMIRKSTEDVKKKS